MISRREFLVAGTALVGTAGLIEAASPAALASTLSPGLAPAADEASTYDPENVKVWFDKTYFNMIVDYYSAVLEWPYGSGITRDNVLRSLKAARPGFILYHCKGHNGITAFKSRLGTEHPKLGGDPLKVLREATREAGVRLCLYYSGLVDGTAAERHPEWQAYRPDGKPYGAEGPLAAMIPLCPASRYFEDWVTIHVEEIVTRYDPDLMWVDGDWGGGGRCFCPRCKKLARGRFGEGAIDRSEYHLWIRNEYRRKFSALLRKYKPTCLYSAGNTTPAVDSGLVNHMDWQSGDWFRPSNHRLMQSLAMRRYTTLGLPYDAMTCDTQFVSDFHARSRHKSLDCLLQEGAGVLANGGKWWYWTYPMPDGALIPSRVRQAKACHEFADQRKDIWLGTQSARLSASVDSGARPAWFGGDVGGLFGATKALIHAHRSPDLIHVNQLKTPIPYQLLIVANRAELTAEHAKLFEEFVRDGGLLLTTGVTARSPGMTELLGIKIVKTNALGEGHVLLKDGTPAGIVASWDRVEPVGAETWWKLYESWGQHHRPKWMGLSYPIDGMLDEEHPQEAGMPAVTARRLGRGLAVHIAADPFAEYWNWGPPTTWRFVKELLQRMQPHPWFSSDAPTCVETSLRVRENELLIHFVNGNPGQDMSKVGATSLYVYDIPILAPLRATVRCRRKPETVFLEPGHRPIPVEWSDGRLSFTLPPLEMHWCVRVSPWPLG